MFEDNLVQEIKAEGETRGWDKYCEKENNDNVTGPGNKHVKEHGNTRKHTYNN